MKDCACASNAFESVTGFGSILQVLDRDPAGGRKPMAKKKTKQEKERSKNGRAANDSGDKKGGAAKGSGKKGGSAKGSGKTGGSAKGSGKKGCSAKGSDKTEGAAKDSAKSEGTAAKT